MDLGVTYFILGVKTQYIANLVAVSQLALGELPAGSQVGPIHAALCSLVLVLILTCWCCGTLQGASLLLLEGVTRSQD